METVKTANSNPPSLAMAVLNSRCPHCREGDMFERPAYRLDSFYKMYPECTHCGQDFLIEPGFYMGASYIGYGFTAVISVVVALCYVTFFPKLNPWIVIGGILAIIAILLPLIFRYGRTLMLYILGGIRFDATLAHKTLFVGADGMLREDEN